MADNTEFIFFCDPDGRVTECLQSLSHALNRDCSKFERQHFRKLLAPGVCEAELVQLEQRLAKALPWRGVLVFAKNKRGTISVDTQVTPVIENGSVRQVIFICRKKLTSSHEEVGLETKPQASVFSRLVTIDSLLILASMVGLMLSWWLLLQNQVASALVTASVIALFWIGFDYLKFRVFRRFVVNLSALLKGKLPNLMTGLFGYENPLNQLQFQLAASYVTQEDQIHRLTHFDSLTGAINRAYLHELLAQQMKQAQKRQSVTLIYIDLDHFKEINDVFGHAIGDQLLVKVAKRIQTLIGKHDILGRLGGDEFGVICASDTRQGLKKLTERILNALAVPYVLGDTVLTLSASIGLASFPQHGNSSEELLKHADVAMYEAKKTGRNAYAVFKFNLAEHAKENMSLEMALRQAVVNQQLVLAFQPQIDFVRGQVIGFEALVRWHHPEWGIIPPDRFIPLAEKTDLIIQISDWVIEQALKFILRLKEGNHTCLRVSVNVSAREFWREGFVERVKKHLQKIENIDACCLEFELTERLAMGEPEKAAQLLRQLRELGVRLAIDDFGTGYSSLNYLRQFPIQVLKIDKSFVQSIDENDDGKAICLSIISLAKALNLETIAEGVETDKHAQALKTLGCHTAQGYHFSKPMFRDETVTWLQARANNQ